MSRGSDLLKDFSEKHETGSGTPARKIDELDNESVWIVEMTRATFRGLWIQAENIFHFSEIAAKEKAAYLERNSGACWEFRISRFQRARELTI